MVTESGFKQVTRVAVARERLLDRVETTAVDDIPLTEADGRALAAAVDASRSLPGYTRAAMDGFAVRAEDTFGASDRSPTVLQESDSVVGPNQAVRVHTGSELPEGADAVVMVEETDMIAGEVEVFDAVAGGENVAPPDEDVSQGQRLYEPGHRLRPSDIGLLRAVGVDKIEVYEQPSVAVIPTGEELVESDPDPGEVVETNGLTVTQLVERWGGDATYRDIVTDDEDALRDAIERDLDHDIVVTTGGSSVGERDLVPDVVDGLGEVFVHGVALKPGHPVALGAVEQQPVLMLPGYPVACIVNAVQFLRPTIKQAGGMPCPDFPTTEATLTRKVASDPGTRTFARVRLREGANGLQAEPTRAAGAGVLSSVALADGWVVVPEPVEGIDDGETVAVQDWEYHA